jgi:DNA-binding winged helix-turn-helix (wHTH) protein
MVPSSAYFTRSGYLVKRASRRNDSDFMRKKVSAAKGKVKAIFPPKIFRSTDDNPRRSAGMDQIVHRVLRFECFALDLARGCLRTGDREFHLRPKTFEVLCYLAQNAGRLVPKQELLETVWPKVTVCDDSLVQCIRELRQKLGDDDRRLIKTVSRRGYLLDVTVSAKGEQSLSHGPVATPAEGAREPAAKHDTLHRALRMIDAHKLRLLGAAAAFVCVALSVIYLFGLPVVDGNPGHVSLANPASAAHQLRLSLKDCADVATLKH